MNSSAKTATLCPAWGKSQVVARKGMPTKAMGLGIATVVLSLSDYYKVFGVHTSLNTTKVINGHSGRDGADEQFIRDSMCQICSTKTPIVPVTVWGCVSFPQPAGVGLINMRPEPLLRSLLSRKRQEEWNTCASSLIVKIAQPGYWIAIKFTSAVKNATLRMHQKPTFLGATEPDVHCVAAPPIVAERMIAVGEAVLPEVRVPA